LTSTHLVNLSTTAGKFQPYLDTILQTGKLSGLSLSRKLECESACCISGTRCTCAPYLPHLPAQWANITHAGTLSRPRLLIRHGAHILLGGFLEVSPFLVLVPHNAAALP
jgi:hypothetical protein